MLGRFLGGADDHLRFGRRLVRVGHSRELRDLAGELGKDIELVTEGVLTRRAPDEEERKNIEYGLSVARSVAGFDIGQTVVVAAQACVAVEAMEGTDAAIERAGATREP